MGLGRNYNLLGNRRRLVSALTSWKDEYRTLRMRASLVRPGPACRDTYESILPRSLGNQVLCRNRLVAILRSARLRHRAFVSIWANVNERTTSTPYLAVWSVFRRFLTRRVMTSRARTSFVLWISSVIILKESYAAAFIANIDRDGRCVVSCQRTT